MKIAYVSNSRFPSERAHSIQIVHNCNAFAAAGAEVTLCVTNRVSAVTDLPEAYYGTPLQFSVQRIVVPDIAGRSGLIPRFLHGLAMSWQRWCFAHALAKEPSVREANIVYGRDEWVLWFLSFWIGSKKLVYESHQAKYNLASKALLRRQVPTVVISEGIEEVYLEKNVPKENILVAHDGIDDSFLEIKSAQVAARTKLDIESDKPIVMYFGGLEDWKGVATLAAATDQAYEVYICGGTKTQVADYQVRFPEATFLGATQYRDLPVLQQAADILVIPNTAKSDLSSKYTSPLKLFAHMCSGVPMVVSDLPSMRAVVDDTEVTFALPDTPSSFREAIKSVLTEYQSAKQQAEILRKRAPKYTWQNRAARILQWAQKETF